MSKLTDLAVRQKKPRSTPYRVADGRGLYLHVTPHGAKSWRYDYRVRGRRGRITLGLYDDVSLAEAREKLQVARKLVAAGVDPAKARKADRRAPLAAVSFTTAARDWLKARKPAIGPSAYQRNVWIVDQELIPVIGAMPLPDIRPTDLLPKLKTVAAAGTVEKAHRVRSVASQVFRYAVAHGWCDRDITADLKGGHALAPAPVVHFPAITHPTHVGDLLRAIDDANGSPLIRAALQLAPLVFVRPGELRRAEWAEVDLPAKLWRIPAGKMKTREDHLVPLSTQAIAILERVQPLTGGGRWVFPALRTPQRPMSDGTLNAALRRLGYSGQEMTAHSFRAMARTLLAEQLHADPYVIEVQLAHAAPGPLGAAYNRARYLPQRQTMMQAWADYLDTLKRRP